MTDLPFEDDIRNPFMPGDDLPKPKIGDVLVLRDMEINETYPRQMRVVDTHDNLGESWDPVGEEAWMQHDMNDIAGFKGHWYAICEQVEQLEVSDSYVVASYEVATIER